MPLAIILLIVIISVANGAGGGGTSVAPGGLAGAQDPGAPPAFPGATADDVVAQAGAAVDADGLTVTTTALTPGQDTLGETLCTTASYNNGTDGAAMFIQSLRLETAGSKRRHLDDRDHRE